MQRLSWEAAGRAAENRRKGDELRALYATGKYKYADLAAMFSISTAQVGNVVKSLAWI